MFHIILLQSDMFYTNTYKHNMKEEMKNKIDKS